MPQRELQVTDLRRAPAEPLVAGKIRIAQAIDAASDEIMELSNRIHASPEIAFEEHQASAWIADAIGRHGFRVQRPAGRLATAIRGIRAGGRGGPKPRIAILAEYDALPELGHGCGHNLMAASGVGAAIGLAAVADELPGEIVFLGTPAEEYGSGKPIMMEDGLFDGVDAALLFHPSDRTATWTRVLALEDVNVEFIGRESHAAGAPWEGRNALDAVVALLVSIALWRQQLRPDTRVHGIILSGGGAANMIPARTTARFMIRSPREAELDEMRQRFRDLVAAAALSTGTRGSVEFSGLSRTMRDNEVLRGLYAANLAAHGEADTPPDNGAPRGSTDMGNVSHVLPTIHPHLAICDEGTPAHTIEFRDAAIGGRADRVLLMAATTIAQTAYDLFMDPALVDAAWAEFRSGAPQENP